MTMSDERGPGQPVVREEEDDGGVDHQPVGERIGELAELGLDLPPARQPAVDLVGDPGDPEDDPGRPARVPARIDGEDDEDRDEHQAQRP